MESAEATQVRSDNSALETLQFREEIQHLIAAPPDNASSFTALLELPAPQAMELLHTPETRGFLGKPNFPGKPQIEGVHKAPYFSSFDRAGFPFPTNTALIERAAKYSVFAGGSNNSLSSNSPENSGPCSKQKVKSEPKESESNCNESPPLVANQTEESKARRSGKRKEPEKKGKNSSKKSKNETSGDAEKLPYVHVRARRGQATDSHSLAERARREKINARMKLLQELVPGCNKISGTALVLDEIINHVQSLQRQVEFLSMRLAAVNPRIEFNLDSVLAPDGGSLVENNFPGVSMPPMWPDVQVSGNREQYQQQWQFSAIQQPVWGRKEDNQNLVTPENSLLSYDSSANSVSLHSNQVKMEP